MTMTAPSDGTLRRRISPENRRAMATGALTAGGVLLLYFIATLIPAAREIAGLRLTPLRVLLLVTFIPAAIKVISGRAGRFTGVDALILLHSVWIVLALMVVHGPSRIPFAGITMVELVGGYFLGRVLIRNVADYRRMVWLLVGSMIFLLPFAVMELITGRLVIPEFISRFAESHTRARSAYGRLGLERVYTVFEHPILFGLFCSVAIANLYFLMRGQQIMRLLGIGFATFMTFMSLSSAPLLSCGLQVMLIIWDRITKSAWTTFIVLAVSGYIIIDLLSNRTPITILIDTMTFNASTGWTRVVIFEYGFRAVMGSPIFGIGFNDWPRPHWLTASVDNFWLLTAMRYGLVGALMLIGAFLLHFYRLMRAPVTHPDAREMRSAYGISLAAVCFCMVTVHVWGAVGVFVMFYMGAGAWFYTNDEITRDPDEGAETSEADAAEARAISRYTRFPVRPRGQGGRA